MSEGAFPELLERALLARGALIEKLQAEGTDAYRLFHGVGEGRAGLTVDRYGSLVLVQTFREPLSPEESSAIERLLRERLPYAFAFAYNHRGKTAAQPFELWHRPAPEALAELECREAGLKFLIRARHAGLDPWLFLDLRAGRRFLRASSKGLSVLNLFAYTCSAGVSAAAGGASEVWNVDFASSNLEVGRRNAGLNGIPEDRFRLIEEDCMPVVRQIAGLGAGGRFSRTRKTPKFAACPFDLVVLDPPAWSKGRFGAVDVVGDYPSLFKPAVLAAKPGGRVLATNHVASVALDAWLDALRRCAEKAGRPLRSVRTLEPDADFPSFDGRPPLKIAVCEV
ncbi:MAG: class I SAM-dependent methyltransferase [Elusimicrobiota bacterium]|jgi:23S rRNA (cytosine1962-C5)-methyltransferase